MIDLGTVGGIVVLLLALGVVWLLLRIDVRQDPEDDDQDGSWR